MHLPSCAGRGRGGRVQLCEQLFSASSASPRAEAVASGPTRSRAAVPLVIVRDVQLELIHPSWASFALGHVDALCRSNDAQRLVLEGRIAPSFAAATGEAPHEIYLSGSRDSADVSS